MTSPTHATVKRLFAVSSNLCAFPKCAIPLVDLLSGKVTGRIAHIRARQPGGPRYDPSQSDAERNAFENLLLLCPVHHDVVDADIESYSFSRLLAMKSLAERRGQPTPVLDDQAAQVLIASASGNFVSNGSVIINQNQMGGQVAHFIQNIGRQPHRVAQQALSALTSELQSLPPESLELQCVHGDNESFELAASLKQALLASAWRIEGGVRQCTFAVPQRGVRLVTSEPREALNVLANWLGAVALNPRLFIDPSAVKPRLVVGANS